MNRYDSALIKFNEIKEKSIFVGISCCFFVVVFAAPLAFAESEIPISKSDSMDKVEFDGRWTFPKEWKQSSRNDIRDPGHIVIRTAHQDNYIYVMLDALADTTIDNTKDNAMVCFDAKSDQSVKPDSNDYCFKIRLGSDKAFTLQGSESGEFKSVGNHKDLIAVGGVSDENDRYTAVPHPTYEFRIPIELLERTDTYGIYLQVFDYSNSTTYSWPSEIIIENPEIPSPAKWGIIYSPDKSLPEYDLPIVVLLLGTFSIILFSWKNKRLNLSYLNR